MEIVWKIFFWLVCGIRNFLFEELVEVILIELDNGEEFMDFNVVDIDFEDMFELLGGLVIVLLDRFVFLVYFLVKEFLVLEDICKIKFLFCVVKYEIELILVFVCLIYFCYDDFVKLLLFDFD